jgi:hypothetical protein
LGYVTYGSAGNSYGPVNLYYGNPVTATTFYINNQAGSGCNDANPGTSAGAPWCTFNNVNNRVFSAGSQILLARGATWYQALRPSGSGTAAAWISIDAYGSGSRPIVRGNNLASDRTIVMTNPDYWSFSNLELSFAGEGILIDYTTLNHQGLKFTNIYAHDITAILHRTPQQTDYPNIWNSAAITIGLDSATPSVSQWVVKEITVDGLEATNTQAVYIAVGGTLLTVNDYSAYPPNAVQNLVVKNGYYHFLPAPGLAVESTQDSYVYSNRVDCVGHVSEPQGTTCFFLWRTTNVVIANNTFENMPDTADFDESAIDLEGYHDRMTERANYFANNAGPGIEFLQLAGRTGDYSTNHEVSSNTFVRNGTGIGKAGTSLLEVSDTGFHAGGTIRDNLYYEVNGLTSGIFTNFVLSNNRPVVATNIFSAPIGFSSTQGLNQWTYQTDSGLGWSTMTTWDATNNRWVAGGGYVDRFNMFPDSCPNCWVGKMWTAPRTGTVSIRGRVFKNDTGGGDGVKVRITRNSAVIWPAAGGTYSIGATDQSGLDANLDSISVTAGDQIRFEVWNGGFSNANDLTSWAPTVAYVP